MIQKRGCGTLEGSRRTATLRLSNAAQHWLHSNKLQYYYTVITKFVTRSHWSQPRKSTNALCRPIALQNIRATYLDMLCASGPGFTPAMLFNPFARRGASRDGMRLPKTLARPWARAPRLAHEDARGEEVAAGQGLHERVPLPPIRGKDVLCMNTQV